MIYLSKLQSYTKCRKYAKSLANYFTELPAGNFLFCVQPARDVFSRTCPCSFDICEVCIGSCIQLDTGNFLF